MARLEFCCRAVADSLFEHAAVPAKLVNSAHLLAFLQRAPMHKLLVFLQAELPCFSYQRSWGYAKVKSQVCVLVRWKSPAQSVQHSL